MEKSSNQIYMDYQAIRQKADQLEELAGELKAIAQNEIADYSSNHSFWEGDSGDACRQKLKKLENNLNKRANELQNTADALRKAAERQYRLEMTLVSLVSR
jgi:WXG100 family type VII secretion target